MCTEQQGDAYGGLEQEQAVAHALALDAACVTASAVHVGRTEPAEPGP